MERLDLYDINRNPLNRTIIRGAKLQKGEYFSCVALWVVTKDRKLFITKRSPKKSAFPNKWENTAGAIQAGEHSLDACQRELFEETGINASKDDFIKVDETVSKKQSCIEDIYLIVWDVKLEDIIYQKGETTDSKLVSKAEFVDMINKGIVAEPVINRFYEMEHLLDEYID
ncbi:MAG: NUDIX hydrolase [Lachnospirales bacterium]